MSAVKEKAANELQLRAAICDVGRRLWQRGLIGGSEGNISCRLDEKHILCTPTGASKGHLRPTDIVTVTLKGSLAKSGTPSSELKLHTRIYMERQDCMAVVHAHPPVATGFSLSGEDIPDNLLPEAAIVLGSVANVPFAMTGTDELPTVVAQFLSEHKAFLLSHHGALVLGSSLDDAYNRMETLERVAHTIFIARVIGTARPMPSEAFDYLLQHALSGRLS